MNLAKIACSYFMRSKTIYCRVYSNIKNEETIHKIAISLWKSGSKKIKRKRKVQVLFVSYKGRVDVNSRPVFIQTEFEIHESSLGKIIPDKIFKCTKKQADRINDFLLNPTEESGHYVSDDEDLESTTEQQSSMNSKVIENIAHPSMMPQVKTGNDTECTHQSCQSNLVKEDENFTQVRDDIIDEESFDNIEMLKSIKFVQDGKFEIYNDRLFLDKPCGHAYGDFIKNRRTHCYHGSQGYELCISRISYLNRFIKTVEIN